MFAPQIIAFLTNSKEIDNDNSLLFYTLVVLNIVFVVFVFVSRYLTRHHEHHHDDEEHCDDEVEVTKDSDK